MPFLKTSYSPSGTNDKLMDFAVLLREECIEVKTGHPRHGYANSMAQ